MTWDVMLICVGLFAGEIAAAYVFLRLERVGAPELPVLFTWPARGDRDRPSADPACAPVPSAG